MEGGQLLLGDVLVIEGTSLVACEQLIPYHPWLQAHIPKKRARGNTSGNGNVSLKFLAGICIALAKLVSTLAINARVPGSNPTIDGYFSISLKALGKPSRLL